MSAQPKFDLAEALNDIFAPKPLNKPSRSTRQRMLEDEVAMFHPDYCEAMELLDSLEHGLNAKFNDDVPEEVTQYFTYLRKALDRADDEECRKNYDPREEWSPEEEDKFSQEMK